MNNKNTLLLACIAIAAIITLKYMQKSTVPYVPFGEAVKGGYVQVIGQVDKEKGVTVNNGYLQFTMKDKIGTLDVEYGGEKPFSFDAAEKIVVMGEFSNEKKKFIADKILTKCPSKYEKVSAQK